MGKVTIIVESDNVGTKSLYDVLKDLMISENEIKEELGIPEDGDMRIYIVPGDEEKGGSMIDNDNNPMSEFGLEDHPALVIKPVCKLTGENGNIFNLIGIASKTLKNVGMRNEANEMAGKCFKSKSYDEALQVIMEYVEIE